MLKKLYEKSRIWFAVLWIVFYCGLMSAGDSLSSVVGVEKSVTLIIGIILSVFLFVFLKKNGIAEEYGLCRSKTAPKDMLYYIPVVVLLTANTWHGVVLNYGCTETILYILSMFSVGFLEEIIFRGLLFNAMREDNLKAAVIVSSVTFGMGHIINMWAGSGAELIPNLLQVIYATGAGFMFVMIYCKTKSLIGCVVTHGMFNALSVFAAEPQNTNDRIISCLMLTLITGSYAVYIAYKLKKGNKIH